MDRCYRFNGFNDLKFSSQAAGWTQGDTTTMPRDAIEIASDLILFGAKLGGEEGFWVNLDPLSDIDQSRHGTRGANQPGGISNYAFANTSTRSFKFGETVTPDLLWAVRRSWGLPASYSCQQIQRQGDHSLQDCDVNWRPYNPVPGVFIYQKESNGLRKFLVSFRVVLAGFFDHESAAYFGFCGG